MNSLLTLSVRRIIGRQTIDLGRMVEVSSGEKIEGLLESTNFEAIVMYFIHLVIGLCDLRLSTGILGEIIIVRDFRALINRIC